MTGTRPVNNDPEMKLIKRRNAKLIARSAVALTLSAAMGTAMIPVPALAEAADQAAATEQQAEAVNEAASTTGQAAAASAAPAAENGAVEDAAAEIAPAATTAPEAEDAPVPETTQEPSIADKLADTQASTAETAAPAFTAFEAVQTSTAEEAPSFDPKDVVYNAGDVSMTVDGESQGSFSVFQIATSWTAGTPVQDANGNWTCTLTIVPKDENKIAGHFGDSGYVLDEANSTLTLTYHYNKWSGWHAFDTADRATVAFKKDVPAFDESAVNEACDVKLLLDGEDQGNFSVSQVADSWTASDPVQNADGTWTVDVTFVPKAENKIAGHFGDNGYELDEANSKLTVTYEYNENSGWHAFEKEERGILAFKTASNTPDNPDQPNVPDKPDQPATPDEPTTPAGPSANTDKNAAASDNGAKQASDKTENKSGTASKQADAKQAVPDTGDTTGIAAMLAAALGAASIALAGACKAFGLRRKDR